MAGNEKPTFMGTTTVAGLEEDRVEAVGLTNSIN
jgi:hypothetical protein